MHLKLIFDHELLFGLKVKKNVWLWNVIISKENKKGKKQMRKGNNGQNQKQS